MDVVHGVAIYTNRPSGEATRRHEILLPGGLFVVCGNWYGYWSLEARSWNTAGFEDNVLHLASSILHQVS